MSHHIIEFENVNYAYPDGREAIRDLSAVIRHGESVGLVGPNGAGKSTLLLLLMGILRPSEGEIRIGGVRQTSRTLPDMQAHMGFVFQNPDHQLFMPGVFDNVAFGPRNKQLPEDQVRSFVHDALDQAGIAHLAGRSSFRLSEGEKRAVSIATALAMQPDILALDEPTSSLDPQSRRQVMNCLQKYEHSKIIATHDLDMVLDICSRVILLHDGTIRADGTPREILTDEKLLLGYCLELPLSLQPRHLV